MKSLKIAAAMAVAVAALASCGNSTPKEKLSNDIDTLSYAVGLAQSQNLRMQIMQGGAIDTTYIDEFIKGLNEGAKVGEDKKKFAYYAGVSVGMGISSQGVKQLNYMVFGDDSTQTISMKNFMAGFSQGVAGKKTAFTVEQAMQIADQKINDLKAKNALKK